MTSQIIPSFANGFYSPWRSTGEALHPNLWRGSVFATNPAIGLSGTTLFDWSGYGAHGSLTGMVPADDWVTDRYGHCLDYDGNDYVNFGDVPQVDGIAYFSCAFWVKPSATQTNNGIVSKRENALGISYSYYARFTTGGAINWFFRTAAGNISVTTTTLVTDTSRWYHIAVVHNGSGTNECKIYVDGKYEAQTNAGGVIEATIHPLWIGAYYSSAFGTNGKIGPVQMWNRSLTTGEIALLASDYHAPYRVKRKRRAVIAAAAPPASTSRNLTLLGVGT